MGIANEAMAAAIEKKHGKRRKYDKYSRENGPSEECTLKDYLREDYLELIEGAIKSYL
jgi:hypothetical protein